MTDAGRLAVWMRRSRLKIMIGGHVGGHSLFALWAFRLPTIRVLDRPEPEGPGPPGAGRPITVWLAWIRKRLKKHDSWVLTQHRIICISLPTRGTASRFTRAGPPSVGPDRSIRKIPPGSNPSLRGFTTEETVTFNVKSPLIVWKSAGSCVLAFEF